MPEATAGKAANDQKQKDAQMNKALELLVDCEQLQGSAFKFIGRCKKCGWQTMQQDEDDAKKAVLQHAKIHWPEIQAAMSAGSSVETASSPKRQEEPTGKRV